jgi:hypothetical protein
MSSDERYLWLFYYRWHGANRIWWAYFTDWSEVHSCVVELQKAFPSLELQSLEARKNGLIVSDRYYSSTCASQERADAVFKETAREREKLFFPLAPYACGYLASFVSGLGDDSFRLPWCNQHSELASLVPNM